MIKHPPANHRACGMYDDDALRGPIPSFQAARRGAQRCIEAMPRLVRSVNSVCLRANGDVALVTFFRVLGGHMAHKEVWNFGQYTLNDFVGGLQLKESA